jgi:hypothetical protein
MEVLQDVFYMPLSDAARAEWLAWLAEWRAV